MLTVSHSKEEAQVPVSISSIIEQSINKKEGGGDGWQDQGGVESEAGQVEAETQQLNDQNRTLSPETRQSV